MEKRYITHLELKNGVHRYFSSTGSMFSTMNREGIDLRLKPQTLYNYWHVQNKQNGEFTPYENKVCIIRRRPIERGNTNSSEAISSDE